jgi:hypothetical protein
MAEQSPIAQESAPRAPADPASSPEHSRPREEERWSDGLDELPPRPRRRLLAPLPVALLAVLMIACGFIAGVLVEKDQGSSGGAGAASTAGLASRFAALRGRAATGAGGSASATPTTAGGAATVGQVAFVDGDTLYVTTAEGNTVKVTTSPGSTVTKTVKASVGGIHPGETVVVTGASGQNGTISASSIRIGAAGGLGGGGLGALLGGSGGSGGSDGGAASGGGRSGEQQLFGGGG